MSRPLLRSQIVHLREMNSLLEAVAKLVAATKVDQPANPSRKGQISKPSNSLLGSRRSEMVSPLLSGRHMFRNSL